MKMQEKNAAILIVKNNSMNIVLDSEARYEMKNSIVIIAIFINTATRKATHHHSKNETLIENGFYL